MFEDLVSIYPSAFKEILLSDVSIIFVYKSRAVSPSFCMSVYMYMSMYVCEYVCMSVCRYVCM